MENIEETITQIYLKNINFFKNHYNSIYEKIVQFEVQKNENYFIEFIDGHFDILDKKGEKLYNCDPFYDAQYRAKEILKNQSNIALIEQKARDIRSSDRFDANIFINQFIEYFEGKEKPKELVYKKTVFIGTLLGVHINDIANVIQSDTYLIVEENIEIFRLSLFFTDYEELSFKSKLFFLVGMDDNNFNKTIIDFFNYNYQDNNFIKFDLMSKNEIKLFETILNRLIKLNPVIYPFSEIVRSYIHGINNFLESKKGILNLSTKHRILNNTPCIFLGAGPSLGKNINLLSKNREKFLIATALSALKELEKADIIPDIIISIDSSEYVVNAIDGVDKKYYQNSIILASINTHKNIFKKLNHKNTYLIQNSLELFPKMGCFTGVSVGDVGVKILLHLGVKKLYLCGIDAAVDQKTGSTHVDSHITLSKKELKESSIEDGDEIDYYEKVIKVKGNLEDQVYSTVYYETIIDSFKEIAHLLKEDVKLYNISSGAYLSGTIPLDPKSMRDLNKVNIVDLREKLNNYLAENGKNSLTDLDKLNFNREYEACTSSNMDKYSGTMVFKIIDQYNLLIKPYSRFLKNNYNIDEKKLISMEKKQKTVVLNEIGKVIKKLF